MFQRGKATHWVVGVAFAALIAAARGASAETMLTGRVYTPEGKPAAKAAVKLYYFHDPTGYGSCWLSETRASDQGDFSLVKPDHKPPAVVPFYEGGVGYYLVGIHPDYTIGIAEFVPGKTGGYTICLDTGRHIRCRIIDGAGKPVKGEEVFPLYDDRGRFPLGRPAWNIAEHPRAALHAIVKEACKATTNNEGRAEFPPIPYGVYAVKMMGRNGWGGIGYMESDGDFDFDVPMIPCNIVERVKVWSQDSGAPLPGMLVAASFYSPEPGRTCDFALTDKDGLCELRFLSTPRGGPITLIALDPSEMPSYAPSTMRASVTRAGDPTLMVALFGGKRLTGNITEVASNEPLAGVPVWTTQSGASMPAQFFRLSDHEGSFDFRINAAAAALGARSPQGFAIPNELSDTTPVRLTNDLTRADLTRRMTPVTRTEFLLVDPHGRAASHVTVLAQQRGAISTDKAYSDVNGRAEIIGLPQATLSPATPSPVAGPILLRALSRDGDFGANVMIPPDQIAGKEPIRISLLSTRTVEAELRDAEDRNVSGRITVWTVIENGRAEFVSSIKLPDDKGNLAAKFDFISGVPYMLYASSPAEAGARNQVFVQQGPVTVGEKEPAPKIILRFREILTSQVPGQAIDFSRDVKSLSGALWSKEDSVEKGVTWYALREGFAYADSSRKEVKRFTEVLGEREWAVNCIVFDKNRVWLGTNKGLLAWNRVDRFMSRFAVAEDSVEAPITELALTDGGTLRATTKGNDQTTRRFQLDPATSKWLELR